MENECRGDGKVWKERNKADPWGKKDCNQEMEVRVRSEEFGVRTGLCGKSPSLWGRWGNGSI